MYVCACIDSRKGNCRENKKAIIRQLWIRIIRAVLSDVNTNNEFMMDMCAKVSANAGKVHAYVHTYSYIRARYAYGSEVGEYG